MDQKERFDLVVLLGETLLSNGGEIFRTNELMAVAARQFGLEQFHAFTIANGIFASALVEGKQYSCQVQYVPLTPIHLGRIEALNDLSRRIAAGEVGPEEARKRVEEIRKIRGARTISQIFASGVGSGAFCLLFGGGPLDCAAAFCAGLVLYAFILGVTARFRVRKVMLNILSSGLVTLLCCVMFHFGFGIQLDKMIIGAIFPLVPGVPLTNAVRNFMENDYIAGLVRLTDAVLVAFCIAAGVGSVMIGWNAVVGGIVL